jgi:hypothetical protein
VHAERGTGASSYTALGAALGAKHRQLRNAGFDVFPAQPAGDPADELLRSCYLLLQTTQLLTGET